MKRIRLVFAALALAATVAPAAAAPERSETPERYTWDLTDLFPSTDAWERARADLAARIPKLAAFEGHLGDSSGALVRALDAIMDVRRDLGRVYTYSYQLADQDARVSAHEAIRQKGRNLYVDLGAATAWFNPELLALDAERVHAYLDADPRLAQYRVLLEDVLRAAPHTLTAPEEAVAAKADLMTNAGENIRSTFVNAEFPYPEVTLSNGERVLLDQAGYGLHRTAPDRDDRMKVFEAFWSLHRNFQGTLASALNEQVRTHVFEKEIRHYGSCLEAAMFDYNVPTSVYTQLVEDVNASLPTFHRYLALRRQMLGVDTLRYQDLYASMVKSVDMTFTPETATERVLEALAPLGDDYVRVLRRGITEERWVDWMPNAGKQGGAYSTGAYGVHPYQLQNFNGIYEDVETLAHEAGHSMHTYLSNASQPFATSDYPIFVAEVASTINENFLLHHMVNRATDPDTKLYLLGNYLDNMRGTLFRQTLFAEFELRIHEMAEQGETLTGEALSTLYLELVRRYYGHDRGVCRVDDVIAPEWAYIDHFFLNFYVYQYATSMTAGITLAKGIRDEAKRGRGTKARDAFLGLLSGGSSKYPMDLLKDAGVDMATPVPFRTAMREMDAIMDDMERLLRARDRGAR